MFDIDMILQSRQGHFAGILPICLDMLRGEWETMLCIPHQQKATIIAAQHLYTLTWNIAQRYIDTYVPPYELPVLGSYRNMDYT